MTKRKIILLASIAVLAGIYIWQSISAGQNTVNDILLQEETDSIRITLTDGSSYTLTRQTIPSTAIPVEGETTTTGETEEVWMLDNGEIAEDFAVSRMESQLQTIRVLGTVSSAGDTERYDLDGDSVLTAEALKDGKPIRTIRVGKTSSTTSQTYAQLDSSSEILLISGTLVDTFGKTADELVVKPEEPAEVIAQPVLQNPEGTLDDENVTETQ